MRDHDECEEAILEAQRRNKHGYAMFIAARCDLHHGHLADVPVAPELTDPTPTEATP
jgi:hypothetical protein